MDLEVQSNSTWNNNFLPKTHVCENSKPCKLRFQQIIPRDMTLHSGFQQMNLREQQSALAVASPALYTNRVHSRHLLSRCSNPESSLTLHSAHKHSAPFQSTHMFCDDMFDSVAQLVQALGKINLCKNKDRNDTRTVWGWDSQSEKGVLPKRKSSLACMGVQHTVFPQNWSECFTFSVGWFCCPTHHWLAALAHLMALPAPTQYKAEALSSWP